MRKAFTLIELLVTIAVLAVIAAGVIALIDPRDKVLQAADAKVQNDIGQLATALQSYAVQNVNNWYPLLTDNPLNFGTTGVLVTTGEMTTVPAPPTQSIDYGTNYSYDVDGTQTTAVAYGRVVSKKHSSKCAAGEVPYWYWNSSSGYACGFCGAAVPTVATITCSFR